MTDKGQEIIYVKGASEIILDSCTKFQGFDGTTTEITKETRDSIQLAIENMANQALRTIIIA